MTHQRNLIPCPFCGGDADISMITSNSVIRLMGFCKECGAMGKMERTEEEAAGTSEYAVKRSKPRPLI